MTIGTIKLATAEDADGEAADMIKDAEDADVKDAEDADVKDAEDADVKDAEDADAEDADVRAPI